MPSDSILKYLCDIESAFNKLESCYVERYEEEILTIDRANIRIRVRFSNGYMFEWNESITAEGHKINHLGYRYHFQDKNNNLIFRYDNTPHFPQIDTFPHHKHLTENVFAVNRPSVFEVLREVKEYFS